MCSLPENNNLRVLKFILRILARFSPNTDISLVGGPTSRDRLHRPEYRRFYRENRSWTEPLIGPTKRLVTERTARRGKRALDGRDGKGLAAVHRRWQDVGNRFPTTTSFWAVRPRRRGRCTRAYTGWASRSLFFSGRNDSVKTAFGVGRARSDGNHQKPGILYVTFAILENSLNLSKSSTTY